MTTTRPLQKYEKICHWADKINDRGQASALCFDPPKAINLKRAKYVFAPELKSDVTCRKCAELLAKEMVKFSNINERSLFSRHNQTRDRSPSPLTRLPDKPRHGLAAADSSRRMKLS